MIVDSKTESIRARNRRLRAELLITIAKRWGYKPEDPEILYHFEFLSDFQFINRGLSKRERKAIAKEAVDKYLSEAF